MATYILSRFTPFRLDVNIESPTNELSQVRLPLTLVASLIMFHTCTPENAALFAVYSPRT